jgi:hypothetical protein
MTQPALRDHPCIEMRSGISTHNQGIKQEICQTAIHFAKLPMLKELQPPSNDCKEGQRVKTTCYS